MNSLSHRILRPVVVATSLWATLAAANSWSTEPNQPANAISHGLESEVDSSSLFSGGRIPNGPKQYRAESKQQHDNWERVLANCVPVATEAPLSPNCYSTLTTYFMDEPVWEYSFEMGYQDLSVVYGLNEGIVNPRHTGLIEYGYDDYASDEIPLWRDIFDGDLEKRIEVFLRTIADPSCNELISSNEMGFQENKSDRCAARELYKYASYLESCTTAFTRLVILKNPPVGDGFLFDNLNTYEAFLSVISELESVDSEKWRVAGGIERMRKGYLHASWVAGQCEANSFVLVSEGDSPITHNWSDLGGPLENDDLRALISRTHFVALKISAKTGEEWAVRSYPLEYFEYSEDAKILSEVRQRSPILVHKTLGFGLGSGLTYSEQRHHRAKAYPLIEELAGADAAQRKFDVSNLQQEIDYVRTGGSLKYPGFWSIESADQESQGRVPSVEALESQFE